MSTGTVNFFNDSKGFGFIKEDNTQKDYFVHSSGLTDVIKEDDRVTFDLEMGKKGLNAVNVKLV
jgi:cold shock protein